MRYPISNAILRCAIFLAMLAPLTCLAKEYEVNDNGLPLLESLPNAQAVIYLNFNGGKWYGKETRPLGGNEIFSKRSQETIFRAWQDISTHFAMFDVNVTTIKPDFKKKPTCQVLIADGMRGAQGKVNWFGRGGFACANPSGSAKGRTTSITHEIGHTFGINHHNWFNDDGTIRAAYEPADEHGRSAFMGRDAGGSVFSMWKIGYLGKQKQDDLAIISKKIITTVNKFTDDAYKGDGFRPDEHGDTFHKATQLDAPKPAADKSLEIKTRGIIERHKDIDMFTFDWPGGALSVLAIAPKNNNAKPPYASSLGMNLKLYDSKGRLLTEDLSKGLADIDAAISLEKLAKGTYFIAIESGGEYEDLGVYDLTISQ